MPTVITQGAASAKGYGFGASATAANYIEDVFSTYLYTGNGSTQTITNGIDLSGKGGAVWVKSRSSATDHRLFDTARGAGKGITPNSTEAESNYGANGISFNNNGFNLGTASGTNASSATYASWTFRKQAKFFDVVTYTGTGFTEPNISHSLGSVPGCIIIKRTNSTGDWFVYHRTIGTSGMLVLNSTAASAANNMLGATPTATTFKPAGDADILNATYVAYLFAHDAGGFGATGTDNVISCGSFTGTSKITLGYEPQFVLMKQSNAAGSWYLYDTMRGIVADPTVNTEPYLLANLSNAEATGQNYIGIDATGFTPSSAAVGPSDTFIYIAIRRGPMKTPTTGTSVFSPNAVTAAIGTAVTTNFPVDLQISMDRGSGGSRGFMDRLRGASSTTTSSAQYLESNSTAAEINAPTARYWNNTGFQVAADQGSLSYVYENFRRAPGFFDVVCYTGNSTTGATQTHNLGLTPELMIVKNRSAAYNWFVYSQTLGATKFLILNQTNAEGTGTFWNNTAPTSSVFTLSNQIHVNGSGNTYVAYLFATVAGVSKVGSYTGTGTTNQINCGFTGGARFVLIKRTDSTGDWYVWDSARGIVAGNDPYLLLNSTAAEVTSTDYIDTYSAGFEISSTAPAAINANGGTFVYLAIS